MKIKGIIFDLDGVIVSTDQFHFKAWKKMADLEGIYFDEEINHQLRGVSRMDSLEIILKNAKKTYTSDEKVKLATFKNDCYVKSLDLLTVANVLPGVIEVLDYLKLNNYKLAIGSSSRNARLILSKIGLTNYFDAIIDGTNITHSKPHPEVFLKACEGLKLKNMECAVVEDAQSGIMAAHNANTITIAIGDAVFSKFAHHKLNKITDIIKILNKLGGK